jgi:hypothetical protein
MPVEVKNVATNEADMDIYPRETFGMTGISSYNLFLEIQVKI